MKLPCELAEHFDNLTAMHEKQTLLAFEGDFSGCGKFDLITECFLENDPILFEKAIPWLQDLVQQEDLVNNIVRLERHRIKSELALYDTDSDSFYIQHWERELKELSIGRIREKALKSFDEFCSTLLAAKDFSHRQCGENYYLTSLLRIVYDAHRTELREQRRFSRPPQKNTLLYQFYTDEGVDLFESDAQYSKYSLYSITDDVELLIGLPSRIFDRQRHVQLFISTPEHLLELFKCLRQVGLIEDLSLLPSDNVLVKTDKQYFFEFGIKEIWLPLTLDNVVRQQSGAVQRTVLRTSDISTEGAVLQPSVSIFYGQDSNDKIWCSITAESMTFEEIAQVPELLEDCAVTQMIHLEYFVNGDRLCVSHIDHEYIFYTHDEFDRRDSDHSQKGNARKRLKTFKIDRSAVPFLLDDGTLFVHTLIEAYFDKPYLIRDFLLDLIAP
ncbi:hypothetical protein PF66_05807 [Pseudomonas asplenii]|uniref:Uncharacterized protein n=1 Tax=Pseudomonas asplenii TaxID=53407 RepID=A0A0N0VIJ7_9PSED|nr:hypothetical protein [Pseudomonas fuscovaginae]KPA87849.1 hypothetical protein PF66_05807 [Pseudomonas fuscovaginae]